MVLLVSSEEMVIVDLHNNTNPRPEEDQGGQGVVVVDPVLVCMGLGKMMVVVVVVHKTREMVLLVVVHKTLEAALLAAVHTAPKEPETVLPSVVRKTLKEPEMTPLVAVHVHKALAVLLPAVVVLVTHTHLPWIQPTSTADYHNQYMLNEDHHSHSAVVLVAVSVVAMLVGVVQIHIETSYWAVVIVVVVVVVVVALVVVVQIHMDSKMEIFGTHNHSHNHGSFDRMKWDQERSQRGNYNRNYNYKVVRLT